MQKGYTRDAWLKFRGHLTTYLQEHFLDGLGEFNTNADPGEPMD
jgi:hypothetical protein